MSLLVGMLAALQLSVSAAPAAPAPAATFAKPADPGVQAAIKAALDEFVGADERARRPKPDLVEVLESTGQVRTSERTRTAEITAKLQNKLPVAVSGLSFRALVGSAKDKTLVDEEPNRVAITSHLSLEPGAPQTLYLNGTINPAAPQVKGFELILESYRLENPSADLVLRMVGEGGHADELAALRSLGLDLSESDFDATRKAAAARADLIDGLKKAALAAPGGSADTQLRWAYAVRALGTLGGSGATDTLISALVYDEALLMMQVQLVARQASRVGEPRPWILDMLRMSTTPAVVLSALKDAAGPKASALLLAAAYGPRKELHSAARQALAQGWRESDELIASLKNDPASLAPLAQVDDAAGVALIVAAARAGTDAKTAEQWLAAVPPDAAFEGIALALGELPGPVPELLTKEIERRGEPARASLEQALKGANGTVPEKAPAAVLAKALAEQVRTNRQTALKETFASFDQALSAPKKKPGEKGEEEDLGPSPRTILLSAEELAREPAEKVDLAQRYARLLTREIADDATTARRTAFVEHVVRKIEGLLRGSPASDGADDAIVALEEKLFASYEIDSFGGRLLAQLQSPKARSRVAQFYADKAKSTYGYASEEWANKALKIDPGNATAQKVIDDRRAAERAPIYVVAVVLALLVALTVIIARTGKRGFRQGWCQVCGAQKPVNHVTFHYNIGMLFARRQASISGWMCKSCIHGQFWKYFLTNLFLGWWGMISFFATPVFAFIDIYHYLHSWLLPHTVAVGAGMPAGPRPPNDEEIQRRIAELLTAGFTHEQIAERLQNDFKISRESTLAFLARLDARLKQAEGGKT